MSEGVEVRLEAATRPQHLASRVAALMLQGASIQTAAQAVGTSWETAKAAWESYQAGGVPAGAAPARGEVNRGERPPVYVEIAAEVARLRDHELMSFKKIAERLVVSQNTV